MISHAESRNSYSILVASVIITFWVSVQYVIPQIFAVPPYNLDAAHIGYLYIGTFLTGTGTCTLLALYYDPLCVGIARFNKGVYEPEFRLSIMGFSLIFTVLGFFGIADAGFNVDILRHGALSSKSISVAAIGCAAYIVDAYRNMTIEIFIISASIKNIYYSPSLYINNWVTNSGTTEVYSIIGGFLTPLVLTTIPMYIFGKKVCCQRNVAHSLDSTLVA